MVWRGWEKFQPVATAAGPVKKAKFHNQPQWVLSDLQLLPAIVGVGAPPGALWFQSKREALRYVVLRLEQDAGAISGLTLQKPFPMTVVTPSGVRRVIGHWICDFEYTRDGTVIVEDCKGFRTQAYLAKRRHIEAEYGLHILET